MLTSILTACHRHKGPLSQNVRQICTGKTKRLAYRIHIPKNLFLVLQSLLYITRLTKLSRHARSVVVAKSDREHIEDRM